MVTHTSIFTLSLLPAFLIVMHSLHSLTASSNSTTSCFVSERNALLDFKHSLTDGSNRLSSWIGDDCCSWVGIRCYKRTGHVITLDLSNPFDDYRLGGELNNSLQILKHLTHLDLSNNDFTGIPVPDFFGSFMNLRYLNLSHSYFTGKVPHHLGNLTSLQYLDLSHNYFGSQNYESLWWVFQLSSLKHLDLSAFDLSNTTDWFPALNMLPSLSVLKLAECRLDLSNIPAVPSNINFTSLVSLDLSYNNYLKPNVNLGGFDWLYNVTGIVELNLRGNFHGGPIPGSIYTLRSLTFLDLSSNEFKGPIPSNISNLSQLRYLYLGYNKFTGNLPESFIKLAFLESLDIFGNQLNGTFPTFISGLSKLEILDMSGNRMSGIISDDYFHNLTRLKYLDLYLNSDLVVNFSSTWTPSFQLSFLGLSYVKVGPSFPQWLHNQRNLKLLDLSHTNIDDTIPLWFSSLNNLRILYLSGNKLRGNPILTHSNIEILQVSNNLLSGLLITNGTTNSLMTLSASNNRLSGPFPSWLCNIKTIHYIDLSNNQLSGRLPSCLGRLENLQVLDLKNNSFYGSLPELLGSLPLYSLQLRNNKFKGHLPSSFQNLTQLQILDVGENAITGVIPTWVGETLSNLGVLSLASNTFHGPIPPQLCHLSYLQTLNLAHNNISGSIPSCFHNLTAMIQIQSSYYMGGVKILEHMQAVERLYDAQYFISMDLSNNNIAGMIPTELMKLVKLVKLDLSGNHIEGRIPDKIGNLIQLESLDLSRNKLSGPIPQTLSNLSFLTNFNLSFNNLSGKIPSGFQLQTLTDPSIYMGNVQLCGAPLNICGVKDGSSDNTHKENYDENDNDDDNVEVWFYSGMGPGLLVGFLGFCGALHFSKRWRYAYFHFFENVYDTLAVAIAIRAAPLQQKFIKRRTEG